MSSIIALIGIFMVALVDYFWFDTERKRWGWMKNLSTTNKKLFWSSFIVIIALVFIWISTDYF